MKSLTVYVSYDNTLLYKQMLESRSKALFSFPETELHPKHQATWVSDLLTTEESDHDVIITTHSKTIISCIGDFIEDIDCSFRDKVTIIILSSDGNITSTFDEEGMLINWPIGWFNGR